VSATNAAVRMQPRTLTVIPGGLGAAPLGAPEVRAILDATPAEEASKTFGYVVKGLVFSWLVLVAVSHTGLFGLGLHAAPR
jgi:hypothetical protein